jgi:DNA-binding NtrC family response regulator
LTIQKLLVIDDDAAVLDFLVESLNERGFQAEGVTAPTEALQRISAEPFDLIITDLQMPGMRGTDMLGAILALRPNQLVLLMTAFGSIDLAVTAVKAGACDFIAKPFKVEALVFAIERAFRDRAMRREIVRLRARLPDAETGTLVARSHAMRSAIERGRRVADLDSIVLITGETGTGKGALARFIHDTSRRARRPFHQVNCASLPATLIESELFGVRRGAFTDAREDRAGGFVSAGEGTLFLDEVGELPLETQAKILHALENGHVRALGATADTPFRARVIAATNRPLEALLRDGLFRPDLYYRLNVIRIELPPLRERRDDLVPLVDALLMRFGARHGERNSEQVLGISAIALRRLMTYRWPGNVRELANAIERAVALCDHDTLLPEDFNFLAPAGDVHALLPDGTRGPMPLEELEQVYVRRVLEAQAGNKAETARLLGINRRTLYRMLERAGERTGAARRRPQPRGEPTNGGR